VDSIVSKKPEIQVLSFPEHHSVHTFLILLLKILKTGHGERVRNVVDSEVIGSLREILSDLSLFGGPIGEATTKLLAAIIHNEPTSYSALHESGLPQAFLRMIRLGSGIPVSAGLINSIPNVFDAICINTQGKELFSKEDFEGFFEIFRSLDHCKVMTRGHCASDAGAGMDELLRHHPDLKDSFMQCFVSMTRDLCRGVIPAQAPTGPKLPAFVLENPEPDTSLFSSNSGEEMQASRAEEERNVPVILFTRVLVSFAEGFFSTAHWIKDFLKEDGHIMLLEIIDAPGMPYDFAESRDHYILRSLMLQFADQHGAIIFPPLIDCTRDALAEITHSKVQLPTNDITDPANRNFDLEEFNTLLAAFSRVQSYLALLLAIYNPQANTIQGRPLVGYTMWLNSEENVQLLESVVTVVLRCVL
jgi:E3 ubiquitin-protein ligase HUWE1